MIRVRFSNLLAILEHDWTEHMDFEDWLIEKIPSLGFDGMDFPDDEEYCFDCYFTSSSEESDAIAVYRLLKDGAKDSAVEFSISISIVDDKFNFIKEITER
ncbi:MAG: hypothetical protein K2N06_02265 [Oscillospiraceae bacterium]|nr:hypothetical protein [Oscillospiraceae bacterium]